MCTVLDEQLVAVSSSWADECMSRLTRLCGCAALAILTVTSPHGALLLSTTTSEEEPRRRHRGGHKRRFCPLGLDMCRAAVRDQQPSPEDAAAAEAEREASMQRIADEVAAKQQARAVLQLELAERGKQIATLQGRLRDEAGGFDPTLEREIASLQASLDADTARAGALPQQSHGNLEAAAAAALPRTNEPVGKVALRGASNSRAANSLEVNPSSRLHRRDGTNGAGDNSFNVDVPDTAPLARVFRKQATRRTRAEIIAKVRNRQPTSLVRAACFHYTEKSSSLQKFELIEVAYHRTIS